jgi:hypothetical protein
MLSTDSAIQLLKSIIQLYYRKLRPQNALAASAAESSAAAGPPGGYRTVDLSRMTRKVDRATLGWGCVTVFWSHDPLFWSHDLISGSHDYPGARSLSFAVI